jgi:hypothetical protein
MEKVNSRLLFRETNALHCTSYCTWNELQQILKGSGVDIALQKSIFSEAEKWKAKMT